MIILFNAVVGDNIEATNKIQGNANYRRISRNLLLKILPDDSPVMTCQTEGYFRDSKDCRIFYYCMEPGAPALAQNCSPGHYFDIISFVCNWRSNVECP